MSKKRTKEKEAKVKEEEKEKIDKELEKATFASIVMRMATGAYISMGLVEDPTTGKKNKDLEISKFLIDSLITLREKTKGNLDKQEEGYLNNIINDLELKYVKEKESK